jgi:hypothetical protein
MAIKTKYTKPASSTLEVTSGPFLPEFAKSAVFTLGQEYVYNSCYGQVTNVSVNKEKGQALLTIYEDASKTQTLSRQVYEFAYDLESQNALVQAYNHIKTLPEFSGAIDC